MFYVGVDTGGTFTDVVAFDPDSGEIVTLKVPSIPEDPSQALLDGLVQLDQRHGITTPEITRLIFGTTVATNAIIEYKGAKTALLATDGNRDALLIQRQWRPRLFDLFMQKPKPYVPRRLTIGVAERIGADGSVVRALTDEEAERTATAIGEMGVDSVAVSLLFSFLDPSHERRLRDAIKKCAPNTYVSLSSDICPEFREYERTCTVVTNAYVMPKIDQLIERLAQRLGDAGFASTLRIMQSNGGLMNGQQARAQPVKTLLSGPAGGVVGAAAAARAAGIDDAITMDMGGTSLDVAMIQGGQVKLSPDGNLSGFPIKVPQVNIHTIGAGGGSIARYFRGTLKVGPESAGADPGPVCYGKGGTEPTSTDAALTLGFINPKYFLGGEVALDADRAKAAITDNIAKPLDLDAADAAMAVVRVQVANMANGIRAVSVEKGLDPREFALLPFGGAGSLYAGLVAEELGMSTILVPVQPSVLSALGTLMSDVKHTEVVTRFAPGNQVKGQLLTDIFIELESRLMETFSDEGIAADKVTLERSCDIRYRGQGYEVNVALGLGDGATGDTDATNLLDRFHIEHRKQFGHSDKDEPVELMNYRVVGVGEVTKAELRPLNGGGTANETAPKGERRAYFGDAGGWQVCPVFERGDLGSDAAVEGPALIEESGTVIVLYPGYRATMDAIGNLRIEVPAS